MLVGIDVDGVVAGFSAYAIKRLGLDPTKNVKWSFEDTYGPEIEAQVAQLINSASTWGMLLPLAYGKEMVAQFKEIDLPYVWCTTIPPKYRKARRDWLSWRLKSKAPLWITANKPGLLKARKVTHFIDDKPANAMAIAAKGIKSYLLCSPYCEGDGPTPGVAHVQDLRAFTALIIDEWSRDLTAVEATIGCPDCDWVACEKHRLEAVAL